MNKHQALLWKIDGMLAFVDLKIWLLIWIMVDLYRHTQMLGDLNGKQTMRVANVMQFVWETCGSPYILWILIVPIADVVLKRILKGMLE